MPTAHPPVAGTFAGFGADALPFLRELREHNDRAWFEANRRRYEVALRAPMEALVGELEGLFGPAHLFRPYRDLRFTNDRRPYKESVAGAVGGRDAVVRRSVHLDARRLRVASGARKLEGPARAAYRRAVDAETSGEDLVAVVRDLVAKGHALEGRTLTRGPRGTDAGHPRLELLKHTRLQAVREYPAGPWLEDASLVWRRVAGPFAEAEPLVEWLRAHLR